MKLSLRVCEGHLIIPVLSTSGAREKGFFYSLVAPFSATRLNLNDTFAIPSFLSNV
jgi:hypothetical protein